MAASSEDRSRSFSAEIDEVCDRFSAQWRAGQRPRLEDYLPDAPETVHGDLLRELLLVELEYRLGARETLGAGEYQQRFPKFTQEINAAFESVLASSASESGPQSLDSAIAPPRGLHIRCPHCHHPIELVDDRPLAEMTCPSCGGEFTLAADETLDSAGVTTAGVQRPKKMSHFELLAQLGTGGFGTVWKARDTKLDRLVAVKIPRKGNLSQDEVEKFLREARTTAQLKHPNIVSVHEVGLENDAIYIVSDFIEGRTLDRWLADEKPIIRKSAELCRKLAEALHHAHEQGVIHRDLKPGNVMIDGQGEPHVMDFGLAKREAGEITMTVEGQILGTPAYMSPEQAKGQGHEADRRTDVYSLGVVLFEMLTGERPFRGNVRMLLKQVIEDEPPYLRKLDSRIPRDMETICLKCLEKEPGQRYRSAREVAEELRRFLAGQPIHSRPLTRTARLWRWCKRQPALATLASAIVLSLLAGTAVSSYFAFVATDQRQQADLKASEIAEYARKLQRRLYFERVARAYQEWHANNITRARRLLDECKPPHGEPDLRQWEWYCTNRLCRGSETTIPNRIDPQMLAPRSLFGQNGRVVITCKSPKPSIVEFKLHDAVSGKELAPSSPPLVVEGSGFTHAVALSCDGRYLAVSGFLGDATFVLDRQAAKPWIPISGQGNSIFTRFTSDGRLLLTLDGDSFDFWDVPTWKKLRSIPVEESGGATAIALSRDGECVAVSQCSEFSSTTVKLWNAADGRLRWSVSRSTSHCIWDLQFSPDGKRLACACCYFAGTLTNSVPPGPVRVLDTATGQECPSLQGRTAAVCSVMFTADSKHLVTGDTNGVLRMWECSSGAEIAALRDHSRAILDISCSEDGKRILSSSLDGTVKSWSAIAGPQPAQIHVSGDEALANRAVFAIAFDAASARIASISGQSPLDTGGDTGSELIVSDLATGRAIRSESFSGTTRGAVAFSPDGKYLGAQADSSMGVWDAETGKRVLALDRCKFLAFSPDSASIAIYSNGGIWNRDLATGSAHLICHEAKTRPCVLAFDRSGARVACVDDSYCLLISDTRSGKGAVRIDGGNGSRGSLGPFPSFPTAVFSPDGQTVISSNEDHTLGVWRANDAFAVGRLELKSPILGVTFHPNGRRLATASGGYGSGAIRIWETDTWSEVLTLGQDGETYLCVAFSPDGKRLVAGTAAGTIRTWNSD